MENWIYPDNTAQIAKLLLGLPSLFIESCFKDKAPILLEQLRTALLHYQHPEIEQAHMTRQDTIETTDRHIRQLLDCTRQVAALLTPQGQEQVRNAFKGVP